MNDQPSLLDLFEAEKASDFANCERDPSPPTPMLNPFRKQYGACEQPHEPHDESRRLYYCQSDSYARL